MMIRWAQKMNNIVDVKDTIFQQAKLRNFAGYDPFDGLNARFFCHFPSLKDSIVGLAWIQLFKRSPINFRPLFGVPEKRNPKGIGLFILGILEEYKSTKDSKLLAEAEELGNWLLEQNCAGDEWTSSCWGYHFDWKARAFFVPKGKPNVITTVYVSRALYQLGLQLGRDDMVNTALSSADFIVNHLYTNIDNQEFFAYIPGETAFVHNASLWAAAWVAFSASQTGNRKYRDLSLRIAARSAGQQSIDGSWVYGERHHHQFIDGFHTGYNLEALYEIKAALDTDLFDATIKKGLDYYINNFFEKDGTAKYYNTNRYPIDPHSVAQAIITLIKVDPTSEHIALAKKILNNSVDTLYSAEKKQFIYQKNNRFSIGINYIRWTQAWMYYSFSVYSNRNHNHS